MESEEVCWRAPLKWRIVGIAFGLFFTSGAAIPYSDESYRESLLVRVGLLLLAGVAVASVMRPKIVVEAPVVRLRGLLRTRLVPLAAIQTVEPWRNGLDLVLSDGRHVLGPALIGQRHEWHSHNHLAQGDAIAQAILSARDASAD